VVERASVELGKVGKQLVVLSSDEHDAFLRKHGRDPAAYRPDIAHHCLLAILDSPLNKSGCVDAIYLHTTSNHLVHISPSTRLPRTFRRFCGLMGALRSQLSHYHGPPKANTAHVSLTSASAPEAQHPREQRPRQAHEDCQKPRFNAPPRWQPPHCHLRPLFPDQAPARPPHRLAYRPPHDRRCWRYGPWLH
jgi:hypothetical protein